MKEIKVIKDFTVTQSGDAFISTRKVSELTGVPRTTLRRWIKLAIAKQDVFVNKNNQLDEKSFKYIVKLATLRGFEKANETIDLLLDGGIRAFIYYNAEKVTPEQLKIANLQEELTQVKIKAIANPRPKLIKSRHEELMSWVNKGWLSYTKSVVPKYTYRILNDKKLTKTSKGTIIRRVK